MSQTKLHPRMEFRLKYQICETEGAANSICPIRSRRTFERVTSNATTVTRQYLYNGYVYIYHKHIPSLLVGPKIRSQE